VATQRYPTLSSERQLEAAVMAVSRQCKVMSAIQARTGTPALRDFGADFAGLAKIVTGQQLSIASAGAIWSRVATAVTPFEPATVRTMPDHRLASLGLSRAKIRTLKAIATAIEDDGLDIPALGGVPDAVVIERLTAVHGIGPWTADVYLLFALRRADAFAPGDLALQLAAQHLFKLNDRPTASKLEAIAERWRPWRAAAARLLWADYGLLRQKAQKSQRPTARQPEHRMAQRPMSKTTLGRPLK
jgi:DNA-3-methyladenine glycosylase II